MIKIIDDKRTDNIVLNVEKQKVLPLISGTSEGYSSSSIFFNIVLEFLAKAIGRRKK
jgi:hypothetical protein